MAEKTIKLEVIVDTLISYMISEANARQWQKMKMESDTFDYERSIELFDHVTTLFANLVILNTDVDKYTIGEIKNDVIILDKYLTEREITKLIMAKYFENEDEVEGETKGE